MTKQVTEEQLVALAATEGLIYVNVWVAQLELFLSFPIDELDEQVCSAYFSDGWPTISARVDDTFLIIGEVD